MTFRTASVARVLPFLIAGSALAIPAFAQTATGQPPSGGFSAALHNAAYEKGLESVLTTPETIGEMLQCSALWDRWAYAVESAADPAFTQGLREELSAGNANSRKLYWQRLARRDMREDDSSTYYDKMEDRAEEQADETYAEYVAGSERGMQSMMGWLAGC
tara:strand:- start:232 stop:714 length:483 start_codon:yes stop_codon:yes gene_type:complete